MCTINIKDIIKDKSYPDAGRELYILIEKYAAEEERIIIDLRDVEALPSMFLNVSIGQYIEKNGVETLKKKISFANITKSQIERLKVYIAHYQ